MGLPSFEKGLAKPIISIIKEYNPGDPTSYLIYLDANNLYGHSMSQPLPGQYIQWVDPHILDQLHILSIPHDSRICYKLEVDLDNPKDLHDRHTDYPLAPESMEGTEDMLSPYTVQQREKLCLKGRPVRKIVLNLNDKSKSVQSRIETDQKA